MKTVRTVYLSGPMSGIEDFNFPAFNAAAERWRKAGWTIINPAESFGGRTDLPREEYIREDIKNLLRAEGIALLSGWDQSKGALLEVQIAIELGLPFFSADSMAPIDTPVVVAPPFHTGPGQPMVRGNVTVIREGDFLILPVSHPNGELFEAKIHIPTLFDGGYQFDGGDTRSADLATLTEKWVAEAQGPDEGHVALEADRLVYGDRNKAYGHPYDDYLCTSRMWEAILLLPPGAIGPEKAALMMALMKVSRASRIYKRDNYVDLCGYAECANRIHLRQEGKE